MAASLQLEVVTPDGAVLNTGADYVGVPGVAGQFGVMPGHVPLLSALAIGELYYRLEGTQTELFISGGFAEVSDNKVSILAESAERKQDIDIERARKALMRAEKRLEASRQGDANIDVSRAHAALSRALGRLRVAGV